MADPRDKTNYIKMHAAWHVETEAAIDAAMNEKLSEHLRQKLEGD